MHGIMGGLSHSAVYQTTMLLNTIRLQLGVWIFCWQIYFRTHKEFHDMRMEFLFDRSLPAKYSFAQDVTW